MKEIVAIGVIWLIGMCSFFAFAAEPVKIAAIFAKTGITAASNADNISGIELAVEKINRQGGILNRPIKLIVLDNKSTPIGSALAGKEAVRLQSMVVIGADFCGRYKG